MGLNRSQIIMLAVLTSGVFITILCQTLVSPAIPVIMLEMGVDAATAQWLTTGFTLVNAVMIPITAYMTDRFPVKTLFIAAMTLFTLGTCLCAWAPLFIVLLAGRLIQAAGAGILMPLGMTVLLLTFPVERRGQAMGLFGIIIMFAPALGPTIAGVIVDNASWRIMFWGVATLCAIDVLLAFFVLKSEKKDVPAGLQLDKLSVVLSTLGFGGMLYGFSVIGSSGFSAQAGVAIAIGLVAVIFFIRRQLKLAVPMLEMRVLTSRPFAVGTAIGMLVQGAIMANAVLIPIYIQNLCGHSATTSGMVLLPGAIIMGLSGPIVGGIFDKRGPRTMAILGILVLTITTFFMSTFAIETSIIVVAVCIALRNTGMSLLNMPLNTWAMNSLDNRYINHGNAVGNTFRQVAGSLGTALVVSAYSLVTAIRTPEVGAVQAGLDGFNFAFLIQGVLFAIAAVAVFVFVRDQKKQGAAGKAGVSSARSGKAGAGQIMADQAAPGQVAAGQAVAEQAVAEQAADAQSPEAALVEQATLAQLMRPAVNVLPTDATVANAIRFFQLKNTDAAVLVDINGVMKGILSDGDIIRAMTPRSAAEYIDPTIMMAVTREDADLRTHVKAILNTDVLSIATKTGIITIDANSELKEVLHTLGVNHLKKAPVVEDGKLVGVIDRSAINTHALNLYLQEEQD